jgi:hypothetical protein
VARTGPLYCRFKCPSFCPVLENTPEMPFLPWAWTLFPVEPENRIAGLPIRGRIGRIRDTVFPEGAGPGLPDHSQDHRKVPQIRALYCPGLPLRTPIFRDFVQKMGALLHTFSGIARYSRFRANRAFCADVQNAFVRFWEADLRVSWVPARGKEKKGCFGGRESQLFFPGYRL